MTQTKPSMKTFWHCYALKHEAFEHMEIEITRYYIVFSNLLTRCVVETHGDTYWINEVGQWFNNFLKSLFLKMYAGL